MSKNLYALNMTARVMMTDDFLAGVIKPGFEEHTVALDLGRDVDLAALDAVMRQAMAKGSEGNREESDAWLAPRVHAALRLRRAEAADRRLWSWLAIEKYPEYVRWRFPGRDGVTALKRFVGGDRDNAIARLWWGAELTRNGGDYTPTVGAFARQDIPNTWFSLDAFHNKAAALAALRMLPTMPGRPINRLSTAFNHYLTTIVLDSVAPASPPDLAATEEWLRDHADAELLLEDELPQGPDEDPVDDVLIDAVEALVRQVAKEVGIPLEPEVSP